MLRRIGFCFRLTGISKFSSVNGLRQLLLHHYHGTCPVRMKNHFFSNEFSEKSADLFADCRSRNVIIRRKNVMKDIVSSVIASYGNNIKWDEVISRSLEAKAEFRINRDLVVSSIIAACESEKLFDAFTSFFKYLVKNKELSGGTFFLLCSVIIRNQTDLNSSADLVYKIFQKLPPSQTVPLQLCCSVLLNSESHRKKVLKNYGTQLALLGNYLQIIATSLNHNDEEAAFKYLKLCKANILQKVIPCFLEYMQKNVTRGTVPTSQFMTIFDAACEKNVSHFTAQDQILLKNFIKSVNNIDTSYKWSFQKTSVLSNCCKTCGGKLNKCTVSDEEIKILRKYLKEKIIFQDNINIRSNLEEWHNFLDFLQKKPYDIVLDGLNILYGFRKCTTLFRNLIREIEKLELTPLILGRKHFKFTPEYGMLHKKYPIFLTENLSDDDVFVLYAALKKGKNCYAVSRDQMGFARYSIDSPQLEDIFVRWQSSHQCYSTDRGSLMLPRGYVVGYQKSPSENQDECRYHVIIREGIERKVYCINRLRRK